MSEERKAPTPVLRKETVENLPVLGTVIVRGLKLSERIRLRRDDRAALTDENATDTWFSRLLAIAVSSTDGKPIYTPDEWDIFGAENTVDMNQILEVALRLGGFDEGVAKKA